MTDKPFGVNPTFLPTVAAPPYPEYIAVIRAGGVAARSIDISRQVTTWNPSRIFQ